MLIWCSAAFFPQNQKHNWKKFYLLSLFLLPRILKHYSQYTRAMCRVYIFNIIFLPFWMKGRTIQVCWYYTGLLYSPCEWFPYTHFTFSTTAIFVHAAHILCKSTYTDENFCGSLQYLVTLDCLIFFPRCCINLNTCASQMNFSYHTVIMRVES